jgi:hypothetical protein
MLGKLHSYAVFIVGNFRTQATGQISSSNMNGLSMTSGSIATKLVLIISEIVLM